VEKANLRNQNFQFTKVQRLKPAEQQSQQQQQQQQQQSYGSSYGSTG
jgi:hypothetical protein